MIELIRELILPRLTLTHSLPPRLSDESGVLKVICEDYDTFAQLEEKINLLTVGVNNVYPQLHTINLLYGDSCEHTIPIRDILETQECKAELKSSQMVNK